MSNNFDNTNRGVLFKNDKDGNEARPDYKGNLNANGIEFEMAAWIKTSKKGNKFMSISIKPKEEIHDAGMNQANQALNNEGQQRLPADDFDDDIPF